MEKVGERGEEGRVGGKGRKERGVFGVVSHFPWPIKEKGQRQVTEARKAVDFDCSKMPAVLFFGEKRRETKGT